MPKYYVVHTGRNPIAARVWGKRFQTRTKANAEIKRKTEQGKTVYLWQVMMKYVDGFEPQKEES